jgi:hypothetical protein
MRQLALVQCRSFRIELLHASLKLRLKLRAFADLDRVPSRSIPDIDPQPAKMYVDAMTIGTGPWGIHDEFTDLGNNFTGWASCIRRNLPGYSAPLSHAVVTVHPDATGNAAMSNGMPKGIEENPHSFSIEVRLR